MAVDRHEVALTANITDFKNKMKEASQTAETMGKKIQNNLSLGKGLFDDNELTRRIIQTDNKVSNLTVNFGKLSQNMALSRQTIGGLSNNLKEVSENANKVEVNTKNIGGSIDKAFTKGLKSVKRLTIGFLGARSAFMLFRKYLGEYQSQNEEFANKMQLTTNVIVNSLAPAFEFFGNVIQYAVIGLARIIELLTGVNILAKTVDNGFKGASKSAKEFNDNLSGLDEISNIDQSSGGLSTGIGSQLNALNEFQDKIKEVKDFFDKSGITTIVSSIGKAFSWSYENLIKPVFNRIISGIKEIVSEWEQMKKAFQIESDAYSETKKSSQKTIENAIKNYQENRDEESRKLLEKALSNALQSAYKEVDYLKYRSNRLSIWNKLFNPDDYAKAKAQYDDAKKYIDELKIQTSNLQGTYDINLDVISNIKSVEKDFNFSIDNIQNKLLGLSKTKISLWPKGSLFNMPSYDVGTNYVPRDQIAMVHEGEAIIPKKYNNSEYLGQMGNSETNALLMELNRSILEFANRPQTLNVNGKELAKVIYGDFQEESSRRGTNASIRRV